MSDSYSKDIEDLKQISHLGHFWIQHSQSKCYNSPECLLKSSNLYRCTACHKALHITCLAGFKENCKYVLEEKHEEIRRPFINKHYWVFKMKSSGKCSKCDKMTKSNQKSSILICSWCKRMLHDAPSCYNETFKSEPCDLGIMKNFIIPPNVVSEFKTAENAKAANESYVINEDIFSPHGTNIPPKPILVFVNPKSGGNLGEKLLQEFRWFLNPDQVFDVFQDKMSVVLSRFHGIPNLHILICGGDGSVSFLYSLLDKMNIYHPDPILAVMPLGTGNDLARALNWGGQYNDSNPIPFLSQMDSAKTVMLDRWSLSSFSNDSLSESGDTQSTDSHESHRKSTSILPAVSFTNYFSCGLDAEVAMSFHSNRAAFPEMYSNRTINKMHYGRIGLLSMLKKSSKLLCDCLASFKVDGVEQISKVLEHKPKCILLINISSYSAGTSPWGREETKEFKKQRLDDGLLEVVFLNSRQMIMLHIGGAAIRFAQCKSVQFVTTEVLPMQVDGEPCKLAPSVIDVKFLKQSPILKRSKSSQITIGDRQRKASQNEDQRSSSRTQESILLDSTSETMLRSRPNFISNERNTMNFDREHSKFIRSSQLVHAISSPMGVTHRPKSVVHESSSSSLTDPTDEINNHPREENYKFMLSTRKTRSKAVRSSSFGTSPETDLDKSKFVVDFESSAFSSEKGDDSLDETSIPDDRSSLGSQEPSKEE